jgi:hypothetical protein
MVPTRLAPRLSAADDSLRSAKEEIIRGLYLGAIALVAFVGLVLYGLWPDKSLRYRDLNCASVPNARAQIICRRLQQEMQWTWFGHAIVAPGWRVGFEGVRRTFCAEHISLEDVSALEVLRRSTRDWRAELGADFLIRLVRNKDGNGNEPVNSIFNPENPAFILKKGCTDADSP